MPIEQVRNADAQLLGSVDHLWAKDRNFAVEAYGGGDAFTSELVLNLGTLRQNYTEELFDLSSNILTFYQAGVYLFMFHSVLTMTGGAAGQASVYLQQDPATGIFTTVPSALSYIYLPPALNSSFQVVLPLIVGFDYRYRIGGIRTSGAGTVQTLNQSTSLAAVLLYNNT